MMSAARKSTWTLTLGIILIAFGSCDFVRQCCCVATAFHLPPLHIGLDAPQGWTHLKTVVNSHRTVITLILVSGIIISVALGFAGLGLILRERWAWFAALFATGFEIIHGFAVLALNRLKLNAQLEGIRLEQLPQQASDAADSMGQLVIVASIGWNIVLPFAIFASLMIGRRFMLAPPSPGSP